MELTRREKATHLRRLSRGGAELTKRVKAKGLHVELTQWLQRRMQRQMQRRVRRRVQRGMQRQMQMRMQKLMHRRMQADAKPNAKAEGASGKGLGPSSHTAGLWDGTTEGKPSSHTRGDAANGRRQPSQGLSPYTGRGHSRHSAGEPWQWWSNAWKCWMDANWRLMSRSSGEM